MPTINKKQPKRPWIPERKPFDRAAHKSNRDVYNTRAWRRDSIAHRTANPLCEQCLRVGLYVDATISDHIKPINEGGDVWDWDNRQALCTTCHNKKSSREGKRPKGGAA